MAGPNWHTAFRASDARAAWRVLEATAGLKDGDDVSVSQVVAVLGPNSQFTILHRTKASLSDDATVWTALDIADADGDGQVDIILRGDAYEDHWLEVFRLENGVWKIAYAGLGYWL